MRFPRVTLVMAAMSVGAMVLGVGCSVTPTPPTAPAAGASTAAASTPLPPGEVQSAVPDPSSTPSPVSTLTAFPTPAPGVPASATVTFLTPTTAPSATATARAVPTAASASVSVRDSSVTFATYPFERFLQPRRDPGNNFTFDALDRGKYDQAASVQALTSRTVHAVILENKFLRLTFLPDLGGRLFQITYKPTNQNLLYNNRELKPTAWGPANQGGWLAAGGMEWALPVDEHGYEWGTPWEYHVDLHSDGTSLTLSDTWAQDRVQAHIVVFLPDDAAYIWIHPEIVNPTARPQRLQFWINTQLSLGASKNVSPSTEFILPTDSVYIHSTGDQFVPEASVPRDGAGSPSAPVAWSIIGGRDLSRYTNWEDYLGVFAADLTQPFVGAYNQDAALGIARVFPPLQVPGVKLFAFGPKFCCRSEFSDDGSDYFELWGGLPRTFFPSDDVTLGPGETRMWDEYWVPFARTGGLSAATRDAVLFVANDNGSARVSAYSAVSRAATLVLLQDGSEVKRWPVMLAPGVPYSATAPVGAGHLQLRLLAADGSTIAESE
jgi:Domain of unknown function (DUF5107)